MKQLLVLTMILALGPGLLRAQDEAAEDEPANPNVHPDLVEDYAAMAAADCTEQQQAKLLEIQKQQMDFEAKWQEQNSEKLEKIEALKARTKDKGELSKLNKQIAKLEEPKTKFQKTCFLTALALLSPKQKAKFQGPRLAEKVFTEFEGVGLTEEQTSKIQTLCEKLMATYTKDVNDDKKIAEKLIHDVARGLLTAEQKKAYEEILRKR